MEFNSFTSSAASSPPHNKWLPNFGELAHSNANSAKLPWKSSQNLFVRPIPNLQIYKFSNNQVNVELTLSMLLNYVSISLKGGRVITMLISEKNETLLTLAALEK